MSDSARPYTLEFYDDPRTGRAPVHEWVTSELSRYQRLGIGGGKASGPWHELLTQATSWTRVLTGLLTSFENLLDRGRMGPW